MKRAALQLPISERKNNGAIAQLVEQRTENPCVPSSILGGTTENPRRCILRGFVVKNITITLLWKYNQKPRTRDESWAVVFKKIVIMTESFLCKDIKFFCISFLISNFVPGIGSINNYRNENFNR